jgi:hypothetical protein
VSQQRPDNIQAMLANSASPYPLAVYDLTLTAMWPSSVHDRALSWENNNIGAVAPVAPHTNPVSIVCHRSSRQCSAPAAFASTLTRRPAPGTGCVGFGAGKLFAGEDEIILENGGHAAALTFPVTKRFWRTLNFLLKESSLPHVSLNTGTELFRPYFVMELKEVC